MRVRRGRGGPWGASDSLSRSSGYGYQELPWLGSPRVDHVGLTCPSLCPLSQHSWHLHARIFCWGGSLHLAQLGFEASHGQLAAAWAPSTLGLPTPWVPVRGSPVGKLPLITSQPKARGVRKCEIPPGALGSTRWEANQRDPVATLGKASLGLQVWPPGPQLFLLLCSILACWCDEEWCAGLCVCGSSTARSKSWYGPSLRAGRVKVSVKTKYFNPGQKSQTKA